MRTLLLSVFWLLFNSLMLFFYAEAMKWFTGPISLRTCLYQFGMGMITAFICLFFHHLLFELVARFFKIGKAKPMIWIGSSLLLLLCYSFKFYLNTDTYLFQALMIGMLPFGISTAWIVGHLISISRRQRIF